MVIYAFGSFLNPYIGDLSPKSIDGCRFLMLCWRMKRNIFFLPKTGTCSTMARWESWHHNSRTTPRTSLQAGGPVSNPWSHFNTVLYVPLIHLVAEVLWVIPCFRIEGIDDLSWMSWKLVFVDVFVGSLVLVML